MMILNQNGDPAILEVCSSYNPFYTGGICKIKGPVTNKGGGKIKVLIPGTVRVHYAYAPKGVYFDLVIDTPNVWLPDRVDMIIEEGTSLSRENILIGT